MGKKRQKHRVRSKIGSLPEDTKNKVDDLLADTSYTYLDISQWLEDEGYEISKSAVGRYALRTNNATKRLMEAQEQAKALVNAVKSDPDIDYTEATMQILLRGLTEKVVSAEEEFQNMPLDKAGRLIVALSRTKAYKDKVKQDMKKKVELAFEGLKEDLTKEIRGDAELSKEINRVLEKAKARMMEDEKN